MAYAAGAFQLGTAVAGLLLLGNWLDKRWGTSPWLALTGLLLGSMGGFYNLLKILWWKQNRDRKS